MGQSAGLGIASRARAEELIQEWAKDWELSCTLEIANDMFFTDDFAVKASFQRQQEAKRELRLEIPADRNSISVFSSNFHATTFGKAFGITVGGRPAVSACVGWGCERWVYALLCQFGFEPANWPAGLKRDFDAFSAEGACDQHRASCAGTFRHGRRVAFEALTSTSGSPASGGGM